MNIYIYICMYVCMYIYIYIYTSLSLSLVSPFSESGARRQECGVASDHWFACFTLDSSHVRTLVLTDVQTPFLGTPLFPLKFREFTKGGLVKGGLAIRHVFNLHINNGA